MGLKSSLTSLRSALSGQKPYYRPQRLEIRPLVPEIRPSRTPYLLSGCMEIHSCVLQDIGPLGPLPCSHSTSSVDILQAGHRVPLTMCNPWITSFWAAALKGTKSCKTQGTFVRSSVHSFVCSSPPGPLRPEICPLRPKICPLKPKICPLRLQISLLSLRSVLSGLKSAHSGLHSALQGFNFAISNL